MALRRVLIASGGIALAFVALIGALFAHAIYVGGKLDTSSKAYVDHVVPEIVGTWSSANLKSVASIELTQSVSDHQIAVTFREFSALGKLVTYGGSEGESKISISPTAGKVVTASYQASTKFERGDAVINIALVQRGDRWQVYGFFVESDQLVR